MKRVLFLSYGIFAYLSFLAALLFAIGFGRNLFVPVKPEVFPLTPFLKSITINVVLIIFIGIQFYISMKMIVKKQFAVKLPEPLERSSVVLVLSIGFFIVMWLWQPIGGTIWIVEDKTIKNLLLFLYFLGWSLVFISTFLIHHADLFGLRQVWNYYHGKPYQYPVLSKPVFLRFARHPLYFGFLIACWSVPVMTVSHLLFACAASGYVIVAMRNMEYDMLFWMEKSGTYRKQTPMMLPFM